MANYFHQRTSQFAESDAAGIIHFSNIARYAEEAEHAFLQKAGYPIDIYNPDNYRWPRINYLANYQIPILPFTPLVIMLKTRKVGNTSLTWKWRISDNEQNTVFCNGEMKTICCRFVKGKISACPIPDRLREILLTD